MLNKIYLALLLIAILVMSVLTFLCYSQLQSIGFAPTQIVQNFDYYDSLHKSILWISSLALLILANIILWTNRKSWALWTSFAYFVVFILLNTWWLSESVGAYKKLNNLPESGIIITGLFGALLCVVIGIGIFFNQFIAIKMRDKIFDKPVEQSEPVPEETKETVAETEVTSNEEV